MRSLICWLVTASEKSITGRHGNRWRGSDQSPTVSPSIFHRCCHFLRRHITLVCRYQPLRSIILPSYTPTPLHTYTYTHIHTHTHTDLWSLFVDLYTTLSFWCFNCDPAVYVTSSTALPTLPSLRRICKSLLNFSAFWAINVTSSTALPSFPVKK